MRRNGVAHSDTQQQANARPNASDMWMGARTMCGETSMVLGITVGERTSVFLATPAMIERLADQIAAMLAVSKAGGHDGLAPRRLPRNRTARKSVAGMRS